jgi:hypothetical protein
VRKIHFIITAGYPGDAALTRRITTWWRLNQAVAGEDGRSDEGRSDDGVVTSRRTRKPGEGIEGSRTTAGPLTRATATPDRRQCSGRCTASSTNPLRGAGRARTCDRRIMSPLLLPTELPPRYQPPRYLRGSAACLDGLLEQLEALANVRLPPQREQERREERRDAPHLRERDRVRDLRHAWARRP